MNLRLQECTLYLDVTSRCKHLYSAQKKKKEKKEEENCRHLISLYLESSFTLVEA